MNLAAIRDLARLQLRDESEEFIPDTELTTWINVGQRELAERLRLIEDTDSGGTLTDSKFALPADFIAAGYLELLGGPVEFVDDESFARTMNGDLGYPYTVARIREGNVEIAPAYADGTEYTFLYTKGPTDLAADGDTSVLPAELHPRLAWYATAMALLKEREEGLADRFMQMFSADLPPSGLGQGRTRPGPFRLRFEPTAHDLAGTHMGVGGYGT